MKIYKPLEALNQMGILCAKSSADLYINNMKKDGMLQTSYKLNNRWVITQDDVDRIKPLIMSGKYKPSTKNHKMAA